MPNKNTFSILPIKQFILSKIPAGVCIDPFSRNSPFADVCITNDLNPEFKADFHLEALDFLKTFDDESVDCVLFDPPYSPRQISECYNQVGKKTHIQDTQSSFYGDRKNEIARILKVGGKAFCFGWNSGGIGKNNGFEMTDILMIAHGGAHNDTICTLETKNQRIIKNYSVFD